MALTINITYTGAPGAARAFADEMVAAGEMELYDGYLVYEKHPWKEEDGKVLFDSGMKGEVFGEAVSPWVEIKGSDDELFLFSYKLVRD